MDCLSLFLPYLVVSIIKDAPPLGSLYVCIVSSLFACSSPFWLSQVNQGLTVYGNKGSTDQHA